MIHTVTRAFHGFEHVPGYVAAGTILAALTAIWLAWSASRHAAWLLSRRNRQQLSWYRSVAQYEAEHGHVRSARQYRWLGRWWWPWAVR